MIDGYQPETIIDQPIPLLSGQFSERTGTNSSGTGSEAITPTTIPNIRVPELNISSEVVSKSLNTLNQAITGSYNFEQLGAFLVESRTHPLANIKFSGDGIVATDATGTTSFALDGETGNATFRGTVTASDFIGGTIAIGSGNTIFKVDSAGNMWIGNAAMASAPFQVSNTGALIASNATISGNIVGATITGGSITIGSNFSVNSSGNLHATGSVFTGGVTISGVITGNNGLFLAGGIIMTSGDISMSGNISLSGSITSIDVLDFSSRSSRPGNTNAIYFYKNGGTYGFRSNMQNSTTWQFDQHAV